jgi:preprotein translocase subunit YajC
LLFGAKSSRNPAAIIEERLMLISPAYAQGFGFGDPNGMMTTILPMVLVLVVFYFLMIMPQQRKAKEHRSMLAALRRGDRVVTGGGIVGTVAKVVSDDEVLVDIADNVRVRVLRSTITSVLAKTEPVAAKSDKDGRTEKDKDKEKDADRSGAEEPEKVAADGDKGKGSARRAAGK